MRSRWIILFVAMGVVAGVSSYAEQHNSPTQPFVQRLVDESLAGEVVDFCSHGKATAWLDKGSYVIADDSSHTYNSLHLDIRLTPDMGANSFDGTVIMTAEANETLNSFTYNLKDCSIQSVWVNGTAATFNLSNEVVTVTPASPIASGAEFTVETNYSGNIYGTNADGGMIESSSTNTLFTFGEPYDTRRWLACYDLPFDKVTSEMRVTIDEDYEVLSNGLLESVTNHGNGTHTYYWINDEPVSTYLIAFSAGPYVIVNDDPAGVNDTPVAYWILPQWQAQAEYDFGRTDEMIDYFEPLFGTYPFVKYDQAMAAIFGGWGAMEHQTCTTMGHNLVNNGNRYYENIVAHELGHMWWGDYVGPRTFKNIWLNEGFASYSEALWAEHFSLQDRRDILSSFRSSFFNHDNSYRHPIYDPPPGHLFCTTEYKKGAWILHMLRWVVGDQNFFDGLQYYASQHAYETAVTPEFQAAMEQVSGMNLTRFFDEWVYGQGYPEYLITGWKVQQNGDTWDATFRLTQSQTNAPYFSTPLPILVREQTSASPVQYRETLVRAQVLPLEEQTVTLSGFELPPDSFEFDPDEWILCTSEYRSSVDDFEILPSQFEVSNVWPNPFNSTAAVTVQLDRPSRLRAEVFDLLGRSVALLADDDYTVGSHRITWTPEGAFASGTYLLRVEAGSQTEIRKLVFLQ
ncbi:T9SS type A sorting domain-containing protein [bacterium]|nr:T9SS type A sorting domain-containing protein [bacterium]